MNVVLHVVTHARTSVERQIHEAEHVKRGHERGGVTDIPEDAVGAAFARPGLPEDGVFGKKSGEGKDAGDGERRNEHGGVGGGNALVQVPHVSHILLAAHGMNHRACPEEEQSFEEGVSEDVEDGGGEGSDAQREEHVAKLRDGRVGEDALDVVLYQADGGGEDGGQRADNGDDQHGFRGQHE